MNSLLRRGTMASLFLLVSIPLRAGFASDVVFLPAVGRIAGNGGAQFFTTVWATNLGAVPITFEFDFLKQGQANGVPAASFTDSLAPGQTKVYENVVETRLGLTSAIGAARILATGDILVAERIFNQAPGTDLGDTEGLFFAAVPENFSISLGQSASIQGLNQGGSENFRYNFVLVETRGATANANVQVFDENGVLLGQRVFPLDPFEQLQPNVADVVPGFSSINARITATVVDGTGSVLLAGAQVANHSQDSSGFEMSFRGDLLGAADGGADVTSLNGLTGAVLLRPGNGISITPIGNSISIAFTGGGSSGLTSVAHDASLTGAGTGVSPLGVAVPLTLASTDSSALVINSTVVGSSTVPISVSLSGSSSAVAFGLLVDVAATLTNNDAAGVRVNAHGSNRGLVVQTEQGAGLEAFTTDKEGVFAVSTSDVGVRGQTQSTAAGIAGVRGVDGSGSTALSSASAGVRGESSSQIGVAGLSTTGLGILGATSSGVAAIRGVNLSSANDHSGVIGFDGTGFAGITGALSAGVRGESGTNIGVLGLGKNFAVVGRLPSGVQGELASRRNGNDFALFASGNVSISGTLTATGTKSFVEPHPADPTKQIRFVCLEGPESGTYFRGHGRIVGGFAKIEVPESFRDVSDENGLTVVATAVGGPGSIWVMRKALDEILLQANSDVEFDYVVNGVRKSYKDFAAIEDNQSFVPVGPDDRRFALYAPEIQRRLVATGIYNADGTVNLETARRLGWDRSWVSPSAEPAVQRPD